MTTKSKPVLLADLSWRSFLSGAGCDCAEVAAREGTEPRRGAKKSRGQARSYRHSAWGMFIKAVSRGYFDEVV